MEKKFQAQCVTNVMNEYKWLRGRAGSIKMNGLKVNFFAGGTRSNEKIVLFAALTTVCLLIIVLSQEFTYVGVAKCQICHKIESQGQQYPIWQKSKHATSLAILSLPKATPTAQAAGVQNPPESPSCNKCHAPLYEKAPELKGEGVTCEVCHGPGGEYGKLSIMKDRAASVKNGLIVYDSLEAIEKQCLTCHANAHGKSFDFAAAYNKIKHVKPEAK